MIKEIKQHRLNSKRLCKKLNVSKDVLQDAIRELKVLSEANDGIIDSEEILENKDSMFYKIVSDNSEKNSKKSKVQKAEEILDSISYIIADSNKLVRIKEVKEVRKSSNNENS